jgi:hypothetical protein
MRVNGIGCASWAGPAGGVGREKLLSLFLIYSKSFSIYFSLAQKYAKAFIGKKIYCLYLYNLMGPAKYIFGFPII